MDDLTHKVIAVVQEHFAAASDEEIEFFEADLFILWASIIAATIASKPDHIAERRKTFDKLVTKGLRGLGH
ncbi:MAG TPA: hypothetical protein VGH84_08770 [Steroidobacteraceae bacterium]